MRQLILCIFFSGFIILQAQDIDYKYGPDKTMTENNLSIYTEFYKQNNYKLINRVNSDLIFVRKDFNI